MVREAAHGVLNGPPGRPACDAEAGVSDGEGFEEGGVPLTGPRGGTDVGEVGTGRPGEDTEGDADEGAEEADVEADA